MKLLFISALNLSLVRFVIVGVINTGFALSIIFLSKWFLHWPDVEANFLGYFCGVILSFFLNTRWTFRFDGKLRAVVLRYCLVLIVAYVTQLVAVIRIIELMPWHSYLAHLIAMPLYTLIVYTGMRFYVYSPARV